MAVCQYQNRPPPLDHRRKIQSNKDPPFLFFLYICAVYDWRSHPLSPDRRLAGGLLLYLTTNYLAPIGGETCAPMRIRYVPTRLIHSGPSVVESLHVYSKSAFW